MHFITSTLVVMASGLLPVFALPHKAPVETRSYTPQSSFSPLGRLNPTYTTEQLNAMKLALTFDERLKLMESFGDPDLYFKFDFTPAGFQSNAGNGQGGQGYPAAVQNYPILLGTGLSMAIGFLGPCEQTSGLADRQTCSDQTRPRWARQHAHAPARNRAPHPRQWHQSQDWLCAGRRRLRQHHHHPRPVPRHHSPAGLGTL